MISLFFGFFPFFWDYAGHLLFRFSFDSTYEILQSVIFLYVLSSYQLVIEIPWDVYHTFVIEARHGFNRQTLKFYIKDQIKSFFLQLFVTTIFTAPLLKVIKWGGPHFYLYAWVFVLAFSLLALTVYPIYIAPIFDKYTPLEDGQLKRRIESLADSLHFPLTKIFVVDASNRSSHSNAYIYGFWKNKRIVLFDTLLPAKKKDEKEEKKREEFNEEEIVAILSHELGHWKLSHSLKFFVLSQLNIFISFLFFGTLMHDQKIYNDFGFTSSNPLLIGLLFILTYVFAPFNTLLKYASIKLSRKHEFEADAFSKKIGYGEKLRSALIKISLGNLGDLNPDSWYSAFYYSHPPLVERLNALNDKEKID
ncbi:CAAX prenyl protease 1 homolog [Zophobas morio]|uniref:CAAX prenyl protease 1 homolog n=1 Tax=Zophobas morio TaxID=2755281 RepID=UPI003082B305